MSDRAAVLLAVVTALGAHLAVGPDPVVGALLVAVALVARRPWLLCLGAALLASGLAVRAWDGLDPPSPGRLTGVVTLVSDPTDFGDGLRFDVRFDGRRYEARATGPATDRIRPRLAGEQVRVDGEVTPVHDDDWLARRHVSARLRITAVDESLPGPPLFRLANGVRRTLDFGSRSLSSDQRSLFAGFVLGDDRGQPPEITDDFRAAGLTHLLAVSGQNVAFVLALATPVLRRLRLVPRLAATLWLIGFFAVVTRFEPSVLRAAFMAGLAAVAATLGRPTPGLRILALAVTALVLIDPFLVHSVGFGLSVAASAGILVLGPTITAALPGPSWLRRSLGVTLAAQAGVAPVLIPVFGGLPVVAPVANLLAVPAAGPVMAWGVTAGLAAGVVGDDAAAMLHLPTAALVGWIGGVARASARLPLGELRAQHLIVLSAFATVALVARRWGQPRLVVARLAAVGVVVVLAAPGLSLIGPKPNYVVVARGAALWRGDGRAALVLDGQARPDTVLAGLRAAAVRRLDAIVLRSDADGATATAGAVVERVETAAVWAPPGLDASGFRPVRGAVVVPLGAVKLTISAHEDRLDVAVSIGPADEEASMPAPPRSRSPPTAAASPLPG